MPFSYRKSIKAGPFRFNLSKSGIGASVGLAGLRFGSGPKGSYISANGARFQYKQLKTPEAQPPRPSRDEELPYKTSQPTASTHGQMEEIESGSVLNMEDSAAPDLLQSINSAYTQPFIWPAVAAASVFILMMSYVFAVEASIAWFIGFVGMVVTLATFFWDEHRRIIVLFYDLDAPMLEKFERLVQSFDDLNASSHKWHIAAKGDVYDSKYHAGASSLVDRKSIALSTTPPTSVKTNISIPTIPVGRQFLCFFSRQAVCLRPRQCWRHSLQRP